MLDVGSLLAGLKNARHETIMAWSPDMEDAHESPRHLMNVLLEVELAITTLERHADRSSSELRGMVAATQGRPVGQ